MSIKLTQYIGVVFLLLASISLSAQQDSSIYIQDTQVETGQIFDLDVRVTDYNDIVSTSFSVFWDSASLRYVGLDNLPFGLSEDDGFGTMNVSSGELSFLYFDMTLQGNTLDDDAVLFTIQLEAIGTDGTQTEVTFGGNIEVVDVEGANNNESLDFDLLGGLVTIGEPNSTFDIDPAKLQVEVMPNPSAADVNVVLEIEQADEVSWVLTETNGQQIANGVTNLAPGRNTLKLENTLFKHTGAYILKMQLGDKIITRRLLRVAP